MLRTFSIHSFVNLALYIALTMLRDLMYIISLNVIFEERILRLENSYTNALRRQGFFQFRNRIQGGPRRQEEINYHSWNAI